MASFSTIELGQIIGGSISSTAEYKQDFVESENLGSLNVVAIDSMNITGSYFVIKNVITGDVTDGFIIGHTIYGILGTGVLGSSNLFTSQLFESGLL